MRKRRTKTLTKEVTTGTRAVRAKNLSRRNLPSVMPVIKRKAARKRAKRLARHARQTKRRNGHVAKKRSAPRNARTGKAVRRTALPPKSALQRQNQQALRKCLGRSALVRMGRSRTRRRRKWLCSSASASSAPFWTAMRTNERLFVAIEECCSL